eukprot:jgi/Hompol1/4344/HPOL_003607-RA
MAMFLPASRKAKFHCRCTIHELDSLPYVSGSYFAKWRLLSGGTAKGTTNRVTVVNNQVIWNASADFDVTLIIGRDDGVLQPCEMRISIKQEINGGRSTEKIGAIQLDLAEVADQVNVSKRMLLQETRLNSVLKITVSMELVKGDASSYTVPAPKSRTGLESPIDVVRGDTIERRTAAGQVAEVEP